MHYYLILVKRQPAVSPAGLIFYACRCKRAPRITQSFSACHLMRASRRRVCASDKNKYCAVPARPLKYDANVRRFVHILVADICSGGSQKSYNPLDKHNIRLGLRRRALTLEFSPAYSPACVCTRS